MSDSVSDADPSNSRPSKIALGNASAPPPPTSLLLLLPLAPLMVMLVDATPPLVKVLPVGACAATDCTEIAHISPTIMLLLLAKQKGLTARPRGRIFKRNCRQ